MAAVTISLNGEARDIPVVAGQTLLEALREGCGIRSVKDGCQPQGQCGACVALVDGVPKTICALPAEKAAHKEIVTLEGLPEAERRQIAEAFAAEAGLQCGFCTPGIALRAKHLTDRDGIPSDAEIAKGLEAHFCRCTGYTSIIAAIRRLARMKHGEAVPAPLRSGGVGSDMVRWRADDHALGLRPYIADMDRPGLLHGAVVLSPHARARVVAIDTSAAATLEGVVAVATAADVPGSRWVGLIKADWPGFVAVGEEVRCVGDVLAAVAAVDERTARAAAALVRVTYEPLPAVLDPAAALAPDAPTVNPAQANAGHPNQLGETVFVRGDVDAALAASAHVVSGRWQTQRIEHLFLEPESALAEPLPDGRLHLFTQGQGIFDDRRQVAGFLGEPVERVFAELVPNGGAFGGKEDMSIQAQAALLARMTGRPVRLTLNREESVRLHPKRHPITMDYTLGCDADGRITALRARILGDSGAYASVGAKVLERAAGHACGPYRVPAVDIHSVAATTNNPPCGAMRGFGVNQTAFAMEGCLDLLAEQVGLDSYEMRRRNVVELGDVFTTGQVLDKSVGMGACLEAVKPHYDAAVAAGKAVGVACGMKNSGIGNGARELGRCRLVVEPDGQVSLYNGFTEMGQGLLTVLVQCVVEVTGLDAGLIDPKVDATFDLNCGQTTGSRGTLLGGLAAKAAAEKLRDALADGATLADLAGRVFEADVVIDDTAAPGKGPKTHTAFGYAAQVVILDHQGRVEHVVAAHDVGRAINPALCRGQIEGGIHMGLGYALTEELPCRDGMPVSWSFRELGGLRAAHMPALTVILVEDPEPEGPFGAKGAGEIGLVPTAPAVAQALAKFDGVRRTVLPMKDSPAARTLSVGRLRAKDRENWH